MRLKLAISALRRKRAYVAGEIEVAERALAKQRQALMHLDATLRLLHPEADPAAIVSIRPILRNLWFRQGELVRYSREALMDAGEPIPTRLVIDYVMRAKGFDREDRAMRAWVGKHTRRSLVRLEQRGSVRRVITASTCGSAMVRSHSFTRESLTGNENLASLTLAKIKRPTRPTGSAVQIWSHD